VNFTLPNTSPQNQAPGGQKGSKNAPRAAQRPFSDQPRPQDQGCVPSSCSGRSFGAHLAALRFPATDCDQ
jgi:hypothetical protein